MLAHLKHGRHHEELLVEVWPRVRSMNQMRLFIEQVLLHDMLPWVRNKPLKEVPNILLVVEPVVLGEIVRLAFTASKDPIVLHLTNDMLHIQLLLHRL